jgi:hypothetical protein
MQWNVEGRGVSSVDVRIVRVAFADWVVGDVLDLGVESLCPWIRRVCENVDMIWHDNETVEEKFSYFAIAEECGDE